MAAPTLQEFRARFSELTAEQHDDAAVMLAIDEAQEIYAIRKTATLYLAAHILVWKSLNTGKVTGGVGVVQSHSLGPIRTTYITQVGAEGDDSALEAWYATTSYGQMFLELKRHSPKAVIGARVVG